MPIAFACSHCGHALKVNDKFAGRKALCPQCEGAVMVPRAGAARPAGPSGPEGPSPAVRGATAVAAAGSLVEEAKGIAALAVEQAYLTRARADQCVAWYERVASRKGGSAPSFGDAMLEQGALTEDQLRELVMGLNRRRHADASSAATARAGAATRECPNCFEIIQKKSRSCRFCGVNLQEPELCDQCPNCGGTQPPGGKLCQGCGVDIQTGLFAGMQKRRCPKCSVLSTGLETVCVVCGTPFDKTRAAVKAEEVAGAAVSTIRGLIPWAVLAAFVLGGLWLFKNWDELMGGAKKQLYGEDKAALLDRVDKFGKALIYKNYDGARAMMANPNADVAAALGKIAGVKEPGESISAVKRTEEQVDGASATVYVDVTIQPPEKPKGKINDPGDLGKLLGGPSERVAHQAWKWTRSGDEWKYAGPQ